MGNLCCGGRLGNVETSLKPINRKVIPGKGRKEDSDVGSPQHVEERKRDHPSNPQKVRASLTRIVEYINENWLETDHRNESGKVLRLLQD